MKKRIVFNQTLRQWEIVGIGMAFDDLSVAYGVATGRLWVTPIIFRRARVKRPTQDGTICLPNPERDF